MNEITITHRETLTKEEGRTIVFNEWLYDGLPVSFAHWQDDHMIKAKDVELTIYDEVLDSNPNSPFITAPGMTVIYSDNGFWITRVTRKEAYSLADARLYKQTPDEKEVSEFTLKLDNKAVNSLSITKCVFDNDGNELWKETLPLTEYIENKKGE